MKMKKFITMALAAVMTLAMSTAAFAAGMTDKETELFNKLKGGFEAGSVKYNFTEADLAKAENYLTANDVADDDVDLIIGNIDEVVTLVTDAGVEKIEDLDEETLNSIADLANDAAAVVGMTAAIGDDGKLSIVDPEGNTIGEIKIADVEEDDANGEDEGNGSEAKPDKVVNKTGFGLEATAAIVALLSVAFVSAAVVSKRKAVEA